ncbi:MAG: bifunctional homocysteine S-methyltransferase/methylenetetrahydrofolate reductase [Spartobacteria bacterium]
MDLIDELQRRLLCGDGAMGTMLLNEGVPLERCLEELCLSEPERVRQIHEAYVAAGAQVIETNTFGANRVRLDRFGFGEQTHEINAAAAQLARRAVQGKDVCVAGSIGPLGITADEAETRGIDRATAFREQLTGLLDGGADAIFFETFLDFEELELALRAKMKISQVPTICSLACESEGRLSSGITLVDAFRKLRTLGADVVGVNCLNGPQATVQLLKGVPLEFLLSAYPNAGYPQYHEGRFIYQTSGDYFAKMAREMAAQGARLIGGCCGTTPSTIAAMAAVLAELEPVRSKLIGAVIESPRPTLVKRAVPAEESLLDVIAAGRRVIICELDPPKTLALEKYFAGAQALVQAGCDAITLADNSLAILRVSNLAIGAMLKERYGITPLLHMSCRDRNLLGLQSELLGMAALGMRHVLPLTGDPARVGDHPGAASVYDVNSIQLIAIARRMNEGFNHAGKALNASTQFVVGCTFNPSSRNLEAQLSRLERKVAAGAQYVMTQPVFDLRVLDEMVKRMTKFNIPVFTGVWPLMSGRQADFLHNEVPGITVPQEVRERMAGSEGDEGCARGVAIAREISQAALERFSGVYLITPFLKYSITVELAAFARSLS